MKHYTRLNILKMKGFDFSNSSFLTLTVSDFTKSNIETLHKAKTRLLQYLKRKYNLRYYVSVSEFQKRGVLHYHLILFNVPYIPDNVIAKVWRLGFVKINKINSYNKDGAFYYLLSYISRKKNQKHLRLVWSRSFQSDGWFSFSSSIYVYSACNKELVVDYPFVNPQFLIISGYSSWVDRRIFRYRYELYALDKLIKYNFYLYSEEVYNHYVYLLERYAFNFLC